MSRKRYRNRENQNSAKALKGGLINRAIWNTEPVEKKDPVKQSSECQKCKSIFFGDTKREAEARKAKHKCPKQNK